MLLDTAPLPFSYLSIMSASYLLAVSETTRIPSSSTQAPELLGSISTNGRRVHTGQPCRSKDLHRHLDGCRSCDWALLPMGVRSWTRKQR
ncbi:hypothetical protein BDQ94DRAFT_136059 [Aspergillus welwitschiae]|uniref:Uncharacterized protein n=1 Tax=Aspergillus welwitschiae TaxID=1341132 RepID=A0A3F3QEI6_9EURO|nr:hypothetical protein BDQ94DRAFT_136059 [Aspergillus welwitschiae]RDH37282.1 hypothetical protein BDQ94DRAFT_136059 [Aspergillus welwitschiae]